MTLVDAPTGALLRDREGRLWLRSTRGAMQLGFVRREEAKDIENAPTKLRSRGWC